MQALIKFGDYNLEKIAQACRDIHKPEKPIQQVSLYFCYYLAQRFSYLIKYEIL